MREAAMRTDGGARGTHSKSYEYGLLGVAIRRDHLITRVHRVCAAPRWNISKTDMAASLTAH
jgi:hypothetical protein